MTELIVLYRMPNDPERFDKYYREVHGPMTSKLPGLKGYRYGPAAGANKNKMSKLPLLTKSRVRQSGR